MAEKKTSIFALLEVLKKYSDQDHILTRDMINNYMEVEYNLTIDRRTLYNNIDMLESFGYDISDYNQNGKGYYLIDRQFEDSEIVLLCNAIHASNFIPNNDSKSLIKKLLSTQSKYVASDFNNMVYVENFKKKDNKEFFYTLSVLMKAIKDGKKISFDYMHYNFDKEMVPRRNEKYFASPYYLVYSNEKTFLIVKSDNHPGFIHYRLDRMKKIAILDQPVNKLGSKEDPYVYAKNKIYMYGGEEIDVQLLCKNEILDDIIDIFGKQVKITPRDNSSFVAKIKSSKQGIIYLALQYLDNMIIIEPQELKQEVIQSLKQGVKRYGK